MENKGAIDTSHYEEFKLRVIEKLTENLSEEEIINKVLPYFAKLINSNLTYEQIKESKSLSKLFQILEFRDKLSEHNIQAIKTIATLINVLAVEIQANQYEMLHSKIHNCITCNKKHQSEDRLDETLIKNHVSQKEKIIQRNSYDTKDIDDAIKTIAPKVGQKWTIIARNLDIEEEDIESIDFDNRFLHDKIIKMFYKWKENNGNEATFQTLKVALNKSRRADLSDMI